MAKKSAVLRDEKRQKMYDKYKDKRAALKAAGDLEGLQKLPRNTTRLLVLTDHQIPVRELIC